MTSPGQPSPDTATATRAATAGDRRFAAVVRHVLGIEGGHSNDAADRGGETNFGISLRFLKAEGRLDLNGDGIADYDLDMDGDIDGADIRLLSPDDAVALYRRCFWDRLGLDRVQGDASCELRWAFGLDCVPPILVLRTT